MAATKGYSIWRTLVWLGLVIVVALIAGAILGRVWQAMAAALAISLVFQLWRLHRFEHWLRRRRFEQPPDYDGLWGEVIATVSRLYRRKQYHKQRNVRMLREFRRLTTAMPDGAILLNAENEILWFNQHAADWLRLQRKRDYGFRIENLLRHPDFVNYLRRVGTDGQGNQPGNQVIIVPMPGEPSRWLSAYLVRTRYVQQGLLIVREVTRQMSLESMRKEFVANASHELRSPLTVVSGYLDALGEESSGSSLDESWRAPVEEMRRQAERMRSIIEDLLELSQLEDHREHAGSDIVDVGGQLSVLKKEILGLPQHPAQVHLRLDTNAQLLGSERELSSAFSNLINNAVKYTPVEGEIEIRWWADEAGGHLSVRDTGIGIAAEHIPRLTERFYRVDAGRAREMGGSGLGLAIVKHALQRHEARLEVQSELGRGSTFVCHFPARRLTHAA
ncbi:MAG TPA: phosphate regulon sensor histidine kinase PhoR [Steroidobacteraceae bacterium]|nr:phosphate regulon sensor histidine kinase PhoR [Steroidobacteraceae bacterium]